MRRLKLYPVAGFNLPVVATFPVKGSGLVAPLSMVLVPAAGKDTFISSLAFNVLKVLTQIKQSSKADIELALFKRKILRSL